MAYIVIWWQNERHVFKMLDDSLVTTEEINIERGTWAQCIFEAFVPMKSRCYLELWVLGIIIITKPTPKVIFNRQHYRIVCHIFLNVRRNQAHFNRLLPTSYNSSRIKKLNLLPVKFPCESHGPKNTFYVNYLNIFDNILSLGFPIACHLTYPRFQN